MLILGATLSHAALAPREMERGFAPVAEVFQTSDGLPENNVTAICQASDRCIWVATHGGAARYDGEEWTAIDSWPEQVPGPKQHPTICAGRDGSVWCSHDRVLRRLAPVTEAPISLPYAPAETFNYPLLEDSQATLWIGGATLHTLRAGLLSERTDAPPGCRNIKRIALDSHGTLWLLGDSLTCYREGVFWDPALAQFAGTRWIDLFIAKDGAVWLSSYSAGVFCHRANETLHLTTDNGLLDNRVQAICESSDGAIWLGSHRGITVWRDGATQSLAYPRGLVYALFRDADGSVWAGMDGAVRFSEPPFHFLAPGPDFANATCAAAAPDHTLWFGSWLSGSYRLRAGQWERIPVVSETAVYSIAPDGHGAYIGAVGGLYYDDGDGGVRLMSNSMQDGRDVRYVFGMARARGGSLWLATRNGLAELRDGKVYSDARLPSTVVNCVLEDHLGSLWCGCENAGLYHFTAQGADGFTSADGLPGDSVAALAEDDRRVLWIGATDGLARMFEGKFENLERTSFGVGARVYCLAPTQNGVWIGTAKGLAFLRYTHSSGIALNTPVFYGRSAGAPSSRFGASAATDADGTIFAPTTQGVLSGNPESQDIETAAPTVAFKRVSVDGSHVTERLTRSGAVTLPLFHGEIHHLAIVYNAIMPSLHHATNYRYKLEGFDKSWTAAREQRSATYHAVPPGSYCFRVMAADNAGLWNGPEASLRFQVLPHWYRTLSFRVAVVAALALSAWFGIRAYLAAIRRRYALIAQERLRIARDLHDSVEQGFTATAIQLEHIAAELSSAQPAAKKLVETASAMIRFCLADTHSFVWDLRQPFAGEMAFGEQFEGAIRRILDNSAVECIIACEVSGERLTKSQRRALLCIAQEAVLNALKHAGPTRISVSLRGEGESAILTVADDGKGFDPHRGGSGFGVIGMNERVRLLRGELSITSAPGKGSVIAARIPTPRVERERT